MTDMQPPAHSPYEKAVRDLRAKGIILLRLPGEFSVNFLNGKVETACVCETLEEAIERGLFMSKDALASKALAATSYKAPKRLSMRPRAVIKRSIKAHNRKLMAKMLKEKKLPDGGSRE